MSRATANAATTVAGDTGSDASIRAPALDRTATDDLSWLDELAFDDRRRPNAIQRRYRLESRSFTFFIIRPDAVFRGQAPAIVDHLAGAGIDVVRSTLIEPTPRVIEELYRYTQSRLAAQGDRAMWWLTPRYYELGPALACLAVATATDDCDATTRLKRLKGPSNPVLGRPGELRFEFDAQNIVMCVLHSAEDATAALREACLFFDDDDVEAALLLSVGSNLGSAVPRVKLPPEVAAPRGPAPDFFTTLLRVQLELVRRASSVAHAPSVLSHLHSFAPLLEGVAEEVARARSYSARAAAAAPAWRSIAARVGPLAIQTDRRDVLVVLRHLVDDESFFGIRFDRLRRFLSDLDVELSPWEAIVLETGLAFHHLQLSGFTPVRPYEQGGIS